MAIPIDLRAKAYEAAAAHVEPDDNSKDMEEALKTYQDESDEQIKRDLEEGLALFARQKPAAQWQAFSESTLTEDIPLLLDRDYLKNRLAGLTELAPQLFAEVMLPIMLAEMAEQHAVASYEAQLRGEEPPLPPEMPPWAFWPQILRCRSLCFEKLSQRFRQLYSEQARKGLV